VTVGNSQIMAIDESPGIRAVRLKRLNRNRQVGIGERKRSFVIKLSIGWKIGGAMTLRTPKSRYSSGRLPSYAQHRGHLISTQLKRVWGKSPLRRTGESQVPQQPNRGSNLGFLGGNPWARRSCSNPPRKRATSTSESSSTARNT
jgi:hypothetical protein